MAIHKEPPLYYFAKPNIFFCFLFSDPPGRPNITGISSESVLIEDQVRRITCISMAGNPLGKILFSNKKLAKLHRKGG